MNEAIRVSMVSLGCARNLVDSEVLLGHVLEEGLQVVSEPQDADVVVVNTCGFVEQAQQESIDTILEMSERVRARGGRLVVVGCLVQRHADELAEALPEVDVFAGTGAYERIDALVVQRDGPRVHATRPAGPSDHQAPRVLSTPRHLAYVRVAEGCSQGCAFCAIPRMRGRARSRPVDDVVREVDELVAAGVVEIVLIAQDLTHYGADLEPPATLAALLRRLVEVPGLRWLRLLYCNPDGLTDEVVELVGSEPRICTYLDVPIQHASDRVLARMRRRTTRRDLERLWARLRGIDDLVLRTTVLVGHPGETDADFDTLCRFVQTWEPDHLGVFCFSPQEGTPSTRQADVVPAEVARRRRDHLMALQRDISRRRLARWVGRTVELLVEGPSAECDWVLQGRTYGQAPEVDGVTYLTGDCTDVRPGVLWRVVVEGAADYDLVARPIARVD